jgi:hypothetical protein
MDETLSVTKSRDVTVQDSLISESLRRSYHSKGQHGYGSLVRGELTPEDRAANTGGYTFCRNLWAHHDARNPSIGGQQKLERGQRKEDRRSTDVNLVNCVVYNWGGQATHRSNDGLVRLNLLGNYYRNGPAKDAEYFFRGTSSGPTLIRHRGNFHDRTVDNRQNGEVVDSPKEVERAFRGMNQEDEILPADPPFGFAGELPSGTKPAGQALENVIRSVGASLWLDSVDQRVIESLLTGTGGLIDSQEELRKDGRLPGIDDLKATNRLATFDTDRDGMPDAYEKKHGLSPSDADDRNGTELSQAGYTNLEVYLDQLTDSSEQP